MDNDSTRNGGRLSLQERAKQGLLLSEPELSIDDIVNLERPGDIAGRKALRTAIRAAIDYGDLTTRNEVRTSRIVRKQSGYWPVGTWLIGAGDPPQKMAVYTSTVKIEFIDREAYRQWRAQCPANLLSRLTQVNKWLGATPALAATLPVESIPHKAVAKPEKRQRNDAMSNAIRAALAVLSPSGGALPRPHELFEHLAYCDATKTITGIAKGNRALHWIDDNGNEQTLTFPALTKRLDRIRQGD